MKLFQWVHRKLGQNSTDPFKDFNLGNPSACPTMQLTLDSQYSKTKPSFSSINQPRFLKPDRRQSQTSWCSKEDKSQEETSAVISELFEGFLTIGTLGGEAVTNEPSTPTFAMPSENITMRDEDVTDNELKLISYELEKFLEAEEETFYESSGRHSYVSNITLSGKQTDGSETEDFGNKAVCPLQGYLLGSSFKLPETIEVRKERVSLAELFDKTKTTNEDCIEKGERETQVKQANKSVMHSMKKMFKMVHSSSKSCNTSGINADSTSTNTKLSKVLRKFQRKVYPEDTINAKSFTKSHEDNGDTTNQDPGRRFHLDSKSRKWSKHCKTNWNPLQDGLSSSGLTGNKEHWIKTDAEYLVLEL